MSRDDFVADAGAMGGGGDNASESLVRDGADVDHGQVVCGEGGMEGEESDATLRKDIVFLGIDLRTKHDVSEARVGEPREVIQRWMIGGARACETLTSKK